MTELHPTIRHLEMPRRIAALPLTDNGYPVLYFADTVNGKPDLRIMDRRKKNRCISEKRCWLCGQPLGRNLVFVIGPMCCITRTSSEPPSHYDCAIYAVKACPFLTRPRAHRREGDLPSEKVMPGFGIARNPGVTAVWITRSYRTFHGGELIEVGAPEKVEWWAEGRQATYPEVTKSIEDGAPLLFEQCDKDEDPITSRSDLIKQFGRLLPLLRGLPGRTQKSAPDGISEAVMIAVRSEEQAWFAMHPDVNNYVRPCRAGEIPSDKPTHVMVTKLDPDGDGRIRKFGKIVGGNFVEIGLE